MTERLKMMDDHATHQGTQVNMDLNMSVIWQQACYQFVYKTTSKYILLTHTFVDEMKLLFTKNPRHIE